MGMGFAVGWTEKVYEEECGDLKRMTNRDNCFADIDTKANLGKYS